MMISDLVYLPNT